MNRLHLLIEEIDYLIIGSSLFLKSDYVLLDLVKIGVVTQWFLWSLLELHSLSLFCDKVFPLFLDAVIFSPLLGRRRAHNPSGGRFIIALIKSHWNLLVVVWTRAYFSQSELSICIYIFGRGCSCMAYRRTRFQADWVAVWLFYKLFQGHLRGWSLNLLVNNYWFCFQVQILCSNTGRRIDISFKRSSLGTWLFFYVWLLIYCLYFGDLFCFWGIYFLDYFLISVRINCLLLRHWLLIP